MASRMKAVFAFPAYPAAFRIMASFSEGILRLTGMIHHLLVSLSRILYLLRRVLSM
jgi:hypothetical protein